MKAKEYTWYGRSLENYKAQHEQTAKSKGVSKQFQEDKTLTAARQILFGVKQKKFTCCRGGCYQCGGKS